MKRPAILYKVFTLLVLSCVVLAPCRVVPAAGKAKKAAPAAPKIGKIFVVSPKASSVVASGGAITVRYNVNDPDITNIKIKVSNGVDAASGPAAAGEARVFLFPGVNTIDLFGFKGADLDSTAHTTLKVECNSECISGALPRGGMVQPPAAAMAAVAAAQPNPEPSRAPNPEPTPKPSPAAAAAKSLSLRLPDSPVNAPTVDSVIVVQEKSGIKRLVVETYQEGNRIDSVDVKEKDIKYQDGIAIVPSTVKIVDGANRINVYDPTHLSEEGFSVTSSLTCKGDKCKAVKDATTAGTESGATDTGNEDEAAIKILQPDKLTTVGTSKVDFYLSVITDIEKLKYEVLNGDTRSPIETVEVKKVQKAQTKAARGELKAADQTAKPATNDSGTQAKKERTELRVPVTIIKGTNTVTFFNAAAPEDTKQSVAINVTCEGENCATDFNVAKFPSSSMNSRVIVGIEQAGGSSAPSETHPVLDLFFMTPFLFDRSEDCKLLTDYRLYQDCLARNRRKRLLPRFGFWGDIRLAATPEQIAAAQVFPTSIINNVTQSGHSVDLVQSFDFLAGAEARIKTANSSFLSLLPGIRQKSSLYFAFGAGAISPLTAKKEAIQIFKVPAEGDARRDLFIERYGPVPDGKQYIAISPVDRDRFLHQWYGGVRLKTYYCDNEECTRFKNTFPSIVDFMFGQNEAVTGGSYFRGGTPDPNNPNKLINQSRSFVFRIDGFYPFPIKKANFLFLYGTAIMKVGGGGVKITTPLFLDNPGTTVTISDPTVYIPPTNILKLQQPDRDYYKIGVGVNLTDLFSHKPPPQ